MRNDRISFLTSVIIHLAVILMLFVGNSDRPEWLGDSGSSSVSDKVDKKGKDEEELISVNIIPKPKKDEQAKVRPEDVNDGINTKTVPHLNDECEDYFGGIGILMTIMRDEFGKIAYKEITKVFDGYPAKVSGLLPGDYIVSSDGTTNIRGPIGSKITLRVIRGGRQFSVTLTRDKICTDGMLNEDI